MNWLNNLWFNYAWASDKGNGPEALQQTMIYAAIAVVLVPPIRKAIERFAKRHAESIKAHVSAETAAVHAKVDHSIALSEHIIKHHPSIPDFRPDTVQDS